MYYRQVLSFLKQVSFIGLTPDCNAIKVHLIYLNLTLKSFFSAAGTTPVGRKEQKGQSKTLILMTFVYPHPNCKFLIDNRGSSSSTGRLTIKILGAYLGA
jgi:hypothetical protein